MAQFPLSHLLKDIGTDSRGQKVVNYIQTPGGVYVPQSGTDNGSMNVNIKSSEGTQNVNLSNHSITKPVPVEYSALIQKLAEVLEKLDEILNNQVSSPLTAYSTEEKPLGKAGDQLILLDTKEVYINDGENWVLF